jgi:ATP-binding cassette subfamily C protein
MITEGANTLSGGQKQRLVIARAVANKPRILFFDEATSALDNRTQEDVAKSLDRLDATRIVVAHRLSTIRNANRIIVIHKGRIGEEGTFEELMKKQGLFYELSRRQMV